MNVLNKSGKVVGTIALVMTWADCPCPGKHGTLMYGFFRTGARKPKATVCNEHMANRRGPFGEILDRLERRAK